MRSHHEGKKKVFTGDGFMKENMLSSGGGRPGWYRSGKNPGRGDLFTLSRGKKGTMALRKKGGKKRKTGPAKQKKRLKREERVRKEGVQKGDPEHECRREVTGGEESKGRVTGGKASEKRGGGGSNRDPQTLGQ